MNQKLSSCKSEIHISSTENDRKLKLYMFIPAHHTANLERSIAETSGRDIIWAFLRRGKILSICINWEYVCLLSLTPWLVSLKLFCLWSTLSVIATFHCSKSSQPWIFSLSSAPRHLYIHKHSIQLRPAPYTAPESLLFGPCLCPLSPKNIVAV